MKLPLMMRVEKSVRKKEFDDFLFNLAVIGMKFSCV